MVRHCRISWNSLPRRYCCDGSTITSSRLVTHDVSTTLDPTSRLFLSHSHTTSPSSSLSLSLFIIHYLLYSCCRTQNATLFCWMRLLLTMPVLIWAQWRYCLWIRACVCVILLINAVWSVLDSEFVCGVQCAAINYVSSLCSCAYPGERWYGEESSSDVATSWQDWLQKIRQTQGVL